MVSRKQEQKAGTRVGVLLVLLSDPPPLHRSRVEAGAVQAIRFLVINCSHLRYLPRCINSQGHCAKPDTDLHVASSTDNNSVCLLVDQREFFISLLHVLSLDSFI